MPALNKILQTAPDALTLLRVFSFCDPENIPISVLKQGCSDLYQESMRDVPVASAVNELEAIIGLFRSSRRLAKAIQEIQRQSLAVYTLEGSERIIRIHDLVQLLLRSKLIDAAEREQWLEMVICIVCKAFDRIDDLSSPRNWVDAINLLATLNLWRVLQHSTGFAMLHYWMRVHGRRYTLTNVGCIRKRQICTNEYGTGERLF